MKKKFDVIIIGGGPGGYKAAENLARFGKKVALIEKENFGGTCLNRGCIPLKTFLHIAKIKDEFEFAIRKGLYDGIVDCIHMDSIIAYKNRVVNDLRKGLENQLTHYNVEMFRGVGKIVERDAEQNYVVKVRNEHILAAEKLILAMGSEPASMFSDKNKDFVVNSDYMLDLSNIPKELVVIGAGVIGLEMAAFFNSLGTRVTVVEMTGLLGGGMDAEVSEVLLKMLKRKGIEVYLHSKVDYIREKVVSCNNEELLLRPDLVLEAIGRKPVLDKSGFEKIGVEYTDNGVVSDENGQTTAEGVYVCGDINGVCMLAHTAYLEADVVSEHLLGNRKKLDYRLVPKILYTNPEVAWVGMTEEECVNEKINYKKIVIPMSYSGRYMVENGRDNAIFKFIYNEDNREILGAHMIGNYASEIILALEVMQNQKMTIEQMKNLIYPHPTVGEIINQAIEFTKETSYEKSSIN